MDWFPKLRDSSPEQRSDHHRLIGNGIGIHWESLGVDLSTQGLLLDSAPTQGDESSKPKRVSYHMVPAGNEWHLKRQGEDRFTSFVTKTEAVRAGVKEARSHEAGQLIIHKLIDQRLIPSYPLGLHLFAVEVALRGDPPTLSSWRL